MNQSMAVKGRRSVPLTASNPLILRTGGRGAGCVYHADPLFGEVFPDMKGPAPYATDSESHAQNNERESH